MNQVDQGGSSAGLPPKPTSTGSFTYINGQVVWVPKTITVPKPKPIIPPKPKPVVTPVITQSTGTGTSGAVPPPPAAKPLENVNEDVFAITDSAIPAMPTLSPIKATPSKAARALEDVDEGVFNQTDSVGGVNWGLPALNKSKEMQRNISIPDTTEWISAGLRTIVELDENGNVVFDENGMPKWKVGSAATLPGTPAYKSRQEIEKWILSGFSDAALPLSMNPVMAAAFGLTEEQRLALGYSAKTTHKPGDLEYLWPRASGLGDGDWSGGDNESPSEDPTLNIEEPVLPPITWEEKYHVEGAPDWWRGMIPDRYDAQSEYASMLNSMIPFMSPEDQRYAASFLFRMYPQYFSSYSSFASNETIPQAPSELTTDQRQYMTSYNRAQAILDTLEKVKQISGNPKLGPGYAYLQELGSVLRDYGARGTGNSQTRQQYQQMMSALDPLVAENQQENLSAYSALTRMLTQPYYTAGQIHPTTTLQDNSVISGAPIKNYF